MTKTILLTGITGFIAKRIALDLLNGGYAVRGSLRSMKRAEEVRDAVRPHLDDPAAMERLEFVTLDLMDDAGWAEAMKGIEAVIHTASPFPGAATDSEDEVIRPAVEGALRALRAARAAGVTRVVLTSSMAAVYANDSTDRHFDESSWSDPDHPACTHYIKSKTLAEKAAWDFVRDHPEMQLSTINPGMVMGRPLDDHWGTSIGAVARILSGRDPAQPDLGFSTVAVEDVSAMHIRAMERDEAIGRRFFADAGYMKVAEAAAILKSLYPDRKIATRVAPSWLLRIIGLWDRTIRSILPSVGLHHSSDTANVRDILGITFIPADKAVAEAAAFLVERGH